MDFDLIEPELVYAEGRMTGVAGFAQNEAHKLIEEFMVAANGTMVAYLGKNGLPMIQRVVRTPQYWDEIVAVAATHGGKLPRDPDATALAKFLLGQC